MSLALLGRIVVRDKVEYFFFLFKRFSTFSSPYGMTVAQTSVIKREMNRYFHQKLACILYGQIKLIDFIFISNKSKRVNSPQTFAASSWPIESRTDFILLMFLTEAKQAS